MMQQSIYFKTLSHMQTRALHTHAPLTPVPHFSFNLLRVLFYSTLHPPPPRPRPIWCPFVLCGPHDTTKPWK